MENGTKIQAQGQVAYYFNGKLIPEKEYFMKYGKKSGGSTGSCPTCGMKDCMCSGGKMKMADGGNTEDPKKRRTPRSMDEIMAGKKSNLMPQNYANARNPVEDSPRGTEQSESTRNALGAAIKSQGKNAVSKLDEQSLKAKMNLMPQEMANANYKKEEQNNTPIANTVLEKDGFGRSVYRVAAGGNKGQIVERNADGTLTQYLDDNSYNRSKQPIATTTAPVTSTTTSTSTKKSTGRSSVKSKLSESIKGTDAVANTNTSDNTSSAIKQSSSGYNDITEQIYSPKNENGDAIPSLKQKSYNRKHSDNSSNNLLANMPITQLDRDMVKQGSELFDNPLKKGLQAMGSDNYKKTASKTGIEILEGFEKLGTNPLSSLSSLPGKIKEGINSVVKKDVNQEYTAKNRNSLKQAQQLYNSGKLTKKQFQDIQMKLQNSTSNVGHKGILE